MIGSTISRLAMADKLSIQQLQQAVQDGTIPAYVGVPLLQEKVKQAQQAKALSAPAAEPTPIAQQVMQEAQGLTAAESNLPEFTAFDGGIVAFARGDLVEDDDDEEDDEDTQDRRYLASRDSMLNELIASYKNSNADMSLVGIPVSAQPMAPAEGRGITAAAPASGITLSSAKEEHKTGIKVPSGHKYEKEIIREAERLGIDPQLGLKIAMLETGGHRSPESATSRAGARGIMQLMPATAEEMGVKDITNPEENIRGGMGYFKRMLDKYGDPKIAGAAYNWGPGNVDRWLKSGADPDKLPAETRKYIASLKEGGEVKKFSGEDKQSLVGGVPVWEDIEGGVTDVMPRSELVDNPDFTLSELQEYNRSGYLPERLRKIVGGRAIGAVPLFGDTASPSRAIVPKFGTPPKVAEKARNAAQASAQAQAVSDEKERLNEQYWKELIGPTSTDELKAGAGTETEKPAETKDTFAEYIKRKEEALSKRRDEDKYMAILAAGLGMMGGTSPYAAANIGAGAMKGVETAAALAKERGLEERGLLRGKIEQARAAESADVRKTLAKQAEEAKFITGMSTARRDVMSKIAKARGQVLESIEDPKLLAKIEQETDAYLVKDPGYQRMYQAVYGTPYKGISVTDYSRWGGLNVSKK